MKYKERVLARTVPFVDCLIWTGAATPLGYGKMWNGSKYDYTHRIVFEASNGLIPDGLEIDHICNTRGCVEVSHLRAVTHQENVARMRRPKRGQSPTCKKGHQKKAIETGANAGVLWCPTCRQLSLKGQHEMNGV